MTRIKVVAHVHSSWSYDASWALPALARSFRRLGYDAVLMSEHDQGFNQDRWTDYRRACAAASLPNVLVVPGIEYSDPDNIVHTPVWGNVPFLGSGATTSTLLQRATAEGGFTLFAHPWRREAWRRFDHGWIPYLSAVEVWNRKYDGWAPRSEAMDFASEHSLRPFVSLDFHNRRQFFPLGLSIDVDGPLSRDAVYEALAHGRFEPLFLGIPVHRLSYGIPLRIMTGLESGRRAVATRLR